MFISRYYNKTFLFYLNKDYLASLSHLYFSWQKISTLAKLAIKTVSNMIAKLRIIIPSWH